MSLSHFHLWYVVLQTTVELVKRVSDESLSAGSALVTCLDGDQGIQATASRLLTVYDGLKGWDEGTTRLLFENAASMYLFSL